MVLFWCSAHKAKEFFSFCTLFNHLFVRGNIRLLDTHTPSLFDRISSNVVLLMIRLLYRCSFADNALLFTLGLIKYEPRWFGPTYEIIKIRLQGIVRKLENGLIFLTSIDKEFQSFGPVYLGVIHFVESLTRVEIYNAYLFTGFKFTTNVLYRE